MTAGGKVAGITVGTATVAAALWSIARPNPSPVVSGTGWWLVLVGAFLLAELGVIVVELRRQGLGFTLGAVPLAVGLVFADPGPLLAAQVLGVGAALMLQRSPFPKAVFNLAAAAFGSGAAVVVYRSFAPIIEPLSPIGWLALLAALVASHVAESAATLLVVRMTGRGIRPSFLAVVLPGLLLFPVSAAIGLAAVALVWVDPRLSWVLLVIGGLVYAYSASNTRLRDRHANLERLYRYTDGLADSPDLEAVVEAVLARTAELLRVAGAELVLVVPGGYVVHRWSEHGQQVATLGRHELDPLIAEVLHDNRPRRIARGTRDPDDRALLAARGWADAVAVPLLGPDMVIGVLVAHDRLGDVGATFGEEELRLLETAGNHAAVALRNSQLVQGLRAEVTAKEHQAMHDALTGLPNRLLFLDRLRHHLRARQPLAVLLLDLDRFKEVNDTLGHPTGDALLVELGDRLLRTVGRAGTVARLGGDEFAVVLPGVLEGDAIRLAHRLRTVIAEPMDMEGITLEVGVSIGLAISPLHGDHPDTLLQRADVALYEAKERGDGVAVYLAERDRSSRRRLALVGELRDAIDHGGITLAYQPKVEAVSGRVVGFEALARWHHPVHGPIGPDEFVTLAEQTGLIQRFTDHVLATALAEAASWAERGWDLSVAVNLSARSFGDARLAERIGAALDRHGVPADRLVIELTESASIIDPHQTEETLHRLSRMGVRISLDDFGTGHSSLARLRRLPVDEVKIDKSFVLQLAVDPDDAAIVRGIIDLARHLGLGVVAEGVETQEVREQLVEMGCRTIQGYFVSRPLPASEVPGWLRSWGSTIASNPAA